MPHAYFLWNYICCLPLYPTVLQYRLCGRIFFRCSQCVKHTNIYDGNRSHRLALKQCKPRTNNGTTVYEVTWKWSVRNCCWRYNVWTFDVHLISDSGVFRACKQATKRFIIKKFYRYYLASSFVFSLSRYTCLDMCVSWWARLAIPLKMNYKKKKEWNNAYTMLTQSNKIAWVACAAKVLIWKIDCIYTNLSN